MVCAAAQVVCSTVHMEAPTESDIENGITNGLNPPDFRVPLPTYFPLTMADSVKGDPSVHRWEEKASGTFSLLLRAGGRFQALKGGPVQHAGTARSVLSTYSTRPLFVAPLDSNPPSSPVSHHASSRLSTW